jgi:hypothetical protein
MDEILHQCRLRYVAQLAFLRSGWRREWSGGGTSVVTAWSPDRRRTEAIMEIAAQMSS